MRSTCCARREAGPRLAAACVRLLTDAALLETMSDNGRELAARHYHERIALGAYRKLYDELMGAGATKDSNDLKDKKDDRAARQTFSTVLAPTSEY